MLDPLHPATSAFLWALGLVFLVVFAVPLLLVPLRWAKIFLWDLPEDQRLTTYFGRCLGAVALAIVSQVLVAAPHPADHVPLLDLIITAGVLLAGVHLVGAVRREQPWTETAEIPMYAGLALLTWWLRLGLSS